MPTFFFDFRRGDSHCRDENGCNFASADEAFLDAFEAAKDMWSEMLGKRQDPRLCSFEIRNEQGHIEYVLPFTEVLDSCRDGKRPAPTPPCPPVVQAAVRNASRAQRLASELKRELQSAQTILRKSRDLVLDESHPPRK